MLRRWMFVVHCVLNGLAQPLSANQDKLFLVKEGGRYNALEFTKPGFSRAA